LSQTRFKAAKWNTLLEANEVHSSQMPGLVAEEQAAKNVVEEQHRAYAEVAGVLTDRTALVNAKEQLVAQEKERVSPILASIDDGIEKCEVEQANVSAEIVSLTNQLA